MNLTTYDNLPPDYGCSKEEIAEIEERQQATCPATYAKILTRVGKIIGSPWEGLYMSYPDILEFKQQLTELLDDLGRTVEIPNDAFVISHYQGFSFHLVCASSGDDPPILEYLEGESALVEVFPSVSIFAGRTLALLVDSRDAYHRATYWPSSPLEDFPYKGAELRYKGGRFRA